MTEKEKNASAVPKRPGNAENPESAVQISHPSLWLRNGRQEVRILDDISLDIRRGERWGIAGESGAGKSMTVYSMTALLPFKGTRMEGAIRYGKDENRTNLLDIPYRDRHRYCSDRVSVILQDAINALNPFERIDRQWIPTAKLHHPDMQREDLYPHLLERLERFGVAGGMEVLKKYPHQLSGGMRQRIEIAMALESDADILIADEPTTSLDAVNQRKIVTFLDDICRKNHLTLIYISHNLGLIESLCDHAAVLRSGRIVEQGKICVLFHAPKHPYTEKLVSETESLYTESGRRSGSAVDKLKKGGKPDAGTLMEVAHLSKHFRRMDRKNRKDAFAAVDDVSFTIRKGEVLGLLGESGCGKSTLARMLLGLIRPDGGVITYGGKDISRLHESAFRPLRRELQMIFQNPFDSLDPRMKVKDLLMEPLTIWRIGTDEKERIDMIREMTGECGLPDDIFGKRPGEFSGGQLQRIAIARALLVRPRFLVADEIVSALDVPVQNEILNLLTGMQRRYGLTVLFITHDLAVIRKVSDRIMIMKEGRLLGHVAAGDDEGQITDPYFRALSEAAFPFVRL